MGSRMGMDSAAMAVSSGNLIWRKTSCLSCKSSQQNQWRTPLMLPSIAKDSPPFVRFEHLEYGVDAEASEKAGRPIPKVIPFALIMQHGSKDVVEKPAEEWLAQIRQKAIAGQYNPMWAERYRLQFE